MSEEIRPGAGIEFVYFADYVKDSIRIMRSLVYDVLEKQMIVSQATPPVLPSGLKKEIVVTYLTRRDGRTTRLGFSAVISDFIKDYELASREQVPAIVIHQTGVLKKFDIRLHYRLDVPSGSGLTLSYGSDTLNLLDISIGGARFSFKRSLSLLPNQPLTLTLGIDGRQYTLEAELLRIWSPARQSGYGGLMLSSVKFLHEGGMVEHLLGKEIFRIQRQLLAESKLLS